MQQVSFLYIISLFICLWLVSVTAHAQAPIKTLSNDSIQIKQEIKKEAIQSISLVADTVVKEPEKLQMQEEINIVTIENDTIQAVFKTDSNKVLLTREDSLAMQRLMIKPFSPNSTKAVIYAAIFPGLGQIYNRKYWKLPILYGGLIGCVYAITWNNKNLTDISAAHQKLMYDRKHHQDEPWMWSDKWKYYDNTGNPEQRINNPQFSDWLKSSKDFYRRYRDLSIFIAIGVYALGIIDAYVDAELFNFDISPDLSMKVEPVVAPETKHNPRTYGVSCHLTF